MGKVQRITVLAFDPGGATGVAYFRAIKANRHYYSTEYGSLTLGPGEHHSAFFDLLVVEANNCDVLHLVTESFEYRNAARPGLELISREYIGILRLFVERFAMVSSTVDEVLYQKQSPAQAKTFVKDDNIRKLGLWKKGKDQRHEMDAQRHLFYYLIHTAKIMPNEFLKIGWK